MDLPRRPSKHAALRAGICKRYLDLLDVEHSPLLSDEQVREQVIQQLDSVVDAVLTQLQNPGEASELGDLALSAVIGRRRAGSGVHPSQSLRAASLIFEAALPDLVDLGQQLTPVVSPHEVSVILNRAILDRMAVAASHYVDFLLMKIHSSNRDERYRLARELHDVAGSSLAACLQSLELHSLYSGTAPAKASGKLDGARDSVREALNTIRALSAQTRESVGRNGLERTLTRYLETSAPGTATAFSVAGDLARLPAPYAEEIFLVAREAVRNAVDHGRPAHVTIDADLSTYALNLCIQDDGAGFDVTRMIASDSADDHIGLTSMRERVELLGGTLTITSRPGQGTTVAIEVPMPLPVGPAAELLDPPVSGDPR